ncbi:hypothetical protein OPT61_g7074 [Boeremia exigua]|uniref:Uncharacterized protein n=1 Tax=Boeremia exigua TaxID=749465 RepID=A0ACC2I3S5_9PLEO|nr:hypothetical protein OPT61_g7074 [Boeremia exigua]
MNIEAAGRQIRAWEAVGAMSPTAIFARLNARTIDSFGDEEITALSRNFSTICNGRDSMSKSAFTSFVLPKIGLSPALTDSLHVLFDSLCYLSQVPLQTTCPPPTELTLEGLQHALMWSMPSRQQSVIHATVGYRIRNLTDHKRLIFQSLSTPVAAHHTNIVPDLQIEATQSSDEGGDEIYEDILDVLVSTQPFIPVGHAEPTRDAYLGLAKQLHKGSPSVNELFTPRSRLESVLSLILAVNFLDRVLVPDEDLKSVARSMGASFCPELRSRYDTSAHPAPTSIYTEGCTWSAFRYATNELLPRLLDPLSDLLGKIFFDQSCPHDAHTGSFPTAEPGTVLTYPRMAQLETFLFNSICIAEIRRFHSYSKITLPKTSEVIHNFERLPDAALLVVSGRSASGEEHVFGAFVARPLTDGPCIQDGAPNFEETAVLFALSPTHDVFRGQKGKPAWTLHQDRMVFGNEGHGAALVLDIGSATARFAHEPSASLEETVYHPNEHREAFEMQFDIEHLELWAEDSS